jgi:hypothetical protein
MIQEQDIVVLTRDFGAHGLKEGDIGTVVHKYRGETLEVEFVTAEGRTIAVLTLTEGDFLLFYQRYMLGKQPVTRQDYSLNEFNGTATVGNSRNSCLSTVTNGRFKSLAAAMNSQS